MTPKVISVCFIAAIILTVLKEPVEAQIVENGMKSLSSSRKMFDGGDIMDGIIGFILDMIEMGSGVLEMITSIGRKKRSTLEDILVPNYTKMVKRPIPQTQKKGKL